MGTRLASVRTQRIRATLQQRQDGTQTIQITVTPSQAGALMSLEDWQALLTSMSRFASAGSGPISLAIQVPLNGVRGVDMLVTFHRLPEQAVTHHNRL